MSQRIPRLEMDALRPDLAQALEPRVKRLGYLGEFFKCTAHVPQALLSFMQFTEALKVPLPQKLTETVALTVACATGNDYERHQHERLSLKLGFGKEWVAAVEKLEVGEAAALSREEQVTQAFVLAALEGFGRGCEAEWEEVVDTLDVEQATAVLLLVGRYATHTIVVNTLRLQPPVPSVFDESDSIGGKP